MVGSAASPALRGVVRGTRSRSWRTAKAVHVTGRVTAAVTRTPTMTGARTAGVVRGEEVARGLLDEAADEGPQRQGELHHQPEHPGGERGQWQREGQDAGRSGPRPRQRPGTAHGRAGAETGGRGGRGEAQQHRDEHGNRGEVSTSVWGHEPRSRGSGVSRW